MLATEETFSRGSRETDGNRELTMAAELSWNSCVTSAMLTP
jgi:hypothetical protein